MRNATLAVMAASLISASAFAANVKDEALLQRAAEAKPEVIALLGRLVNIDSGTGSEKGLDAVSAIVAGELKKLGMKVELVSAAPAAVGHNLVATLTGSGRAKILLLAHMDTVFADGSAAARPFRIDGNRAYGPGVTDDKGGIVTAIYALRLLQQQKFTDFAQITLMINSNEETFSKGSRGLIESLAAQHDATLSLEPGRAADGLVVWRKGTAELAIEVKGKASHAGAAPEAGRNAAMEAAHQMLQMAPLGDSSKLTTVNFTVFNSGDRVNVIPSAALVRGDMRARQPDEFDRVEKEMARLASNKLIPDTAVKATLTRGMPPMPPSASTEALAARAQAIYGELGLKLTMEGSGGAGDANFIAATGRPVLDGFGIAGGNYHADDEYVELNTIAPRLYLLTRMMIELGRQR
ncbi:MAG: glutamate carboxypeptidase [Sphingomonadaceae bacterium]